MWAIDPRRQTQQQNASRGSQGKRYVTDNEQLLAVGTINDGFTPELVRPITGDLCS